MLLQIGVPVVLSTLIVLALAGLVLGARRWLEPSGVVTIDVNGERTLEVAAGDPLLWTLADHGIQLPAACGGRGTCGQCRVTVTSGGGEPLPTEAVHVTPAERAAGVRLACMLRVVAPLRIVVPRAALAARRWSCTVVSNRNVATHLKELVLQLPAAEKIHFRAGEYVVLEAPPHHVTFRDFDIDAGYHNDWQDNGLLALESVSHETVRRAYSLANAPQEDDRIVLVVRIATPPANAPEAPPGRASSYIFALKPGDTVKVSGPFGDFHATDTHREMVLIGGGAGMAPLRSIVLDQLARGTNRKMSFWYGARDRGDLCYERELSRAAEEHDNFEFHVALSSARASDDWTGHKGFIHRVVHDRYLRYHDAPWDVEYYLCGPPVMTAAVVDMLERLGVDHRNIFFDDFGS